MLIGGGGRFPCAEWLPGRAMILCWVRDVKLKISSIDGLEVIIELIALDILVYVESECM